MSDKKLTVSEFAGKIKAKYPEYKDINDLELAKKVIAKYPEYESVVVFEEDSKKKEASQEPFRFGISELPSDSQSQDPEKPSEEDQAVDDVLAFSDAFNPVGRIIKKTPVLAELNSGIESMVGSAFKLGEMFVRENVLAYATANPGYAAAQNAINSAAPVDSKIADALGSVGDVFMESSSRAMKQKYKDYGIPDSDVELGIIGNLSEGNISSAAKLTASTMVQQVPQLAVMAATGGTAGGVVLGATAAGGKYAEIQDDLTLTSQEKALYSLAIGTAEGIAENIFKTDVTQFRRIFNKKETTEAFKDELKKQLKKETLWRSSREEATEEFLVAVTDNLIESGLKGNFDNWDRDAVLEIADNTLIGGLMGGGVHSVSRGVNAIGTTKNERKILEAKQDVSDLYSKLENATEDQKPIIEELIEERLGFIIDTQSEDAEFYKNFTPEDLNSVNELNKEIRKNSKKYNLAASESQKKVIKKELDELRSKKAEIENKYSENPSRYIRDGKEVSRAEFIDMINNATPEELTTGQWGVQNDDEVDQLLMNKLPQDDRKEEERVSSAEQEGEAPVQEEPIQEPSPEEAAPSRVVQEAEEVAPTEEVDTESIKIEKETISDAEFRIEDLQSEIDIEKGNIKEAKDKSKEDIAAVRKSDLTADEKKERIAEIKAELQDAVDEMNGNIGIYKEDISAFKSDIRKAQKKLAKLEAPKAVATVKEPTPSVPEEAQIKPEDVVSEKDAQGNERFFAAYPVKDKPIKAFFEVKTDKDGNIIRVSDKSYGPARKTLKKRLQAETVSKKQIAEPVLKEVTDAKAFSNALSEAKDELSKDERRLDLQVSAVTEKEAQKIIDDGGKVFMTSDGLAGGFVTADGYIGGIFKDPRSKAKGVAGKVIQQALQQGGKYLDAYGTELENIYIKQGFRPVARVPFAEQYADKGWDSPKSVLKGKPDVVFFVYDPDNAAGTAGEGRVINEYTEAEKYTRKVVESTEKTEGPAVEETGEELDILLLDEDGIIKKESELGGSDPRNVQSGKMTVTYGKDGITFRSKEETGVMGNKGEYFVSYEDINTIPGINKLERGTPEYSYRVAAFAGVAKQYKDPVLDMFDRIINPDEIGKKGFNSKGRFTESEAKRMSNMIDSFKKTLKRLGLNPVNIVLVDSYITAKQYQRYITGTEKTNNTRGTFIPYANTIIINLGKADFSTLAHEMMHAYIYAMKLKGNRVVEFAKIIEQELIKGTEQEQLLAQELIAFRNAYVDQKIYGDRKVDDPYIAEEFLAQYVGLMSQFSEKLGPSKQITFADKVRAAIIKFLNKIGIADKNLVTKIETRVEALNFINGFFDAVNNRTDAVFEKADTETEEQGEGGEVGTISIPKQQIEVIDAPKLSEDKRSFIQKFVTGIKMTALQGRKFVTNMYDYTNAGVTNLGNGFSITLFGGRNYVPMMMERNGVGIGDVSNLAAFNTKSNAEGFIKNAIEGKADLFAPHSGTLTDSWQFQHHIFEELVKLVLDNKILSKAELIQTFNEGLKSKAAVEAFATFNERNKSKLKNLSSFKKDPMKLVELLNADNNYSPKLRKALNQKIASNKKFQKAIGIKNLREFYNRISDPLNQGVSGGEIMTFVEFDPKSFKIVKTKPGDVNHHPSFGWVVMAKIKGIYHPDKYYKSYDITESYTKYNADGTKVERKGDTTKKKYIDSNVKSSAGAIPKVAKVEMPKEQIDFAGSEMINEFSLKSRIYNRSTGKSELVTIKEKGDNAVAIKFPDGIKAVVRTYKEELKEAEEYLKDVRDGVYPYANEDDAKNKRDILALYSKDSDFAIELLNKNNYPIGKITLANDHFNYYFPRLAKEFGEDYKKGLIYTADNRRTTDAVYIEPEYRGKGYGARLYHSALRLLREQVPGARIVSNHDSNLSKSAKNFWRGHTNQGLAKVVLNTATAEEIEEMGGPKILKQLKDIGMEYTGDIYELLDPTERIAPSKKYDVARPEIEKQQIDWQPSLFGREKVNTAIITRSTQLQGAVQELLEGKITNAEYQEMAKLLSPVDPISQFFLPASDEDMQNALGKGKAKKLNAPLEDGEYVGLRLDIPAYVNNNIWVVTAHKGTGAPLTYGSVAWATDVKFGTNPKVAAFIAAGKNMDLVGRYRIDPVEVDGKTIYKFYDTKTGKYYAEKGKEVTKNDYKSADRFVADRLEKQDKSTIGKMLGKWKNFEGKTKEDRDASAIKKVEEIVKVENSYPGSTRKGSPWRQIGMNPFRHSFFYDRRTGKPVVSAAEVVQIGGLVYAKDVEYADWSDDQFTVDGYKDADGQPVKFQIEGDAESKVEQESLKALEDGEIPAPLYKKTWYQRLHSALFRTPLETEILKLQEKKEAQISDLEQQAREIANRIKKYAKTPEALKLSNEYLTADNKKDAVEAIKKLPTGQKLLDNLRTARAFIDNISDKFVSDPAFDGLPDELKFSIQNNISTYLRTSYRFFTDKSYNIDKKRKPAIQAQFNRLVAEEIGILSAMGVDKMDISRIVNEKRDELVAEATQMIDSYISDLKEVKYQPSIGGMGIKMPNAPFRSKKDLPDYIKQLLGEEKNPVNRFAQTSKSLANIYYKSQMINGIIDLVGENSDYILDKEPTGVKGKQYKKVNDPYSLLDGKWVHNEVLNAVDQQPLFTNEDPVINGYFRVLKLARKSKVIWNVTTWRKNLTGGWYFILANGIVNPTFYKDFTRRTKLMFNVKGEKFQVDDKTKELMRIMAEKGVSGKSIDANMIGVSQAAMQFSFDGDENAYAERVKRIFNNISNKDKWLQEKYAAVDDYTKLVIFRSEIESYAKKLYGKNYEQLNDKQKDSVHEEAAERVKQSTPTFSRLPKWYPKIAWIPIVGDFISFRLESLRSYGMNVSNAVSDIKKSQESGLSDVQKKEYLTAGLRRLSGSGAVFALKLAITKVLTQWFLDDDDEKLEEDVKRLRPDWMEGQSIIPRSVDKDGNVRVYNYSSEDPYGDVSDVFGGPESWGAMVKDFIRPNIAASLLFNLSKGEDIYGRKIADYSDTRLNNMLKVMQYTGKQIIVPPTVSSSFRDAWVKSDLPKEDKAVNLATTIAERSLIRDYKYNIVDSFVQDLRKISGTRKNYTDYDNPTLRLKQLDEINEKFKSIVAIGLAKENYDLIDKAERLMKRHLGDDDQDYVLDGILIEK